MELYRGIAVSVAGSDSGGGAGIQADLKTCAALKVFGMTVITALTAQNSREVSAVWNVPAGLVHAQMDALWSDFPVGAAKTGMLAAADTIRAVASGIRRWNVDKLVVDPVMIAQSGASLIDDDAVAVLREELLPLALIVTPNIPEAEKLSGFTIETIEDMEQAAEEIAKSGSAGRSRQGRTQDAAGYGDRYSFPGGKSIEVHRRADFYGEHTRDGLYIECGHSGGAVCRNTPAGGSEKGKAVSQNGT